MGKLLDMGPFSLQRYGMAEQPEGLNIPGRYIICCAEALDPEREILLVSKGFQFHDRILLFEIDTCNHSKGTAPSFLPDVRFTVGEKYDDDVFRLACQAFSTDRRFHLDPAYDQQKANLVIREYLRDLQARNLPIYRALHEQELLGFAIVDEKADEKGMFFENVLAATMPGIKGKMVAIPLYEKVLEGERDRFRKYRGRVSSSNMPSLNLHIRLGGTVKQVYDEYIFIPEQVRKNEEG